MQKLSNAQLAALLDRFQPLKCWRTGLSHGSILYFEMKETVIQKLTHGKTCEVGTASLALVGDKWIIRDRDALLVTSDVVSRLLTEGCVADKFVDKRLRSFVCNPDSSAFIEFDDDLVIVVTCSSTNTDPDEPTIELFLPDGAIVWLNKTLGLHVVDDISLERRQHWLTSEKRRVKKCAPS